MARRPPRRSAGGAGGRPSSQGAHQPNHRFWLIRQLRRLGWAGAYLRAFLGTHRESRRNLSARSARQGQGAERRPRARAHRVEHQSAQARSLGIRPGELSRGHVSRGQSQPGRRFWRLYRTRTRRRRLAAQLGAAGYGAAPGTRIRPDHFGEGHSRGGGSPPHRPERPTSSPQGVGRLGR